MYLNIRNIGLFVLLLAAVSTQAVAQNKVDFQLSWIPTGQFAAYFAGIANGFYKDEGIDLSIQRGASSGEAVRRVAAGGALFGDGDISAVMTGRVREQLKIKCVQSVYTQSPHSLMVLEGSGISSLKDLEGKSVGTTAGNSHQVYFPILASMNKVDPSKVKFVTVDPTAVNALLLSGQIDAATQFSINYYVVNQQAEKVGKKVKVLPYADYGFKIYSVCIHTRDETISTRPDLVAAFLRATKRSFEWMRDNPEKAAELHKKANPEADVAASLGEIRAVLALVFNEDSARVGFGNFDAERLQLTWKIVSESQKLDPSTKLTEFVDTRFVPPRTGR
jgi:NitT/TauT family transport system substrate-binding protein